MFFYIYIYKDFGYLYVRIICLFPSDPGSVEISNRNICIRDNYEQLYINVYGNTKSNPIESHHAHVKASVYARVYEKRTIHIRENLEDFIVYVYIKYYSLFVPSAATTLYCVYVA